MLPAVHARRFALRSLSATPMPQARADLNCIVYWQSFVVFWMARIGSARPVTASSHMISKVTLRGNWAPVRGSKTHQKGSSSAASTGAGCSRTPPVAGLVGSMRDILTNAPTPSTWRDSNEDKYGTRCTVVAEREQGANACDSREFGSVLSYARRAPTLPIMPPQNTRNRRLSERRRRHVPLYPHANHKQHNSPRSWRCSKSAVPPCTCTRVGCHTRALGPMTGSLHHGPHLESTWLQASHAGLFRAAPADVPRHTLAAHVAATACGCTSTRTYLGRT